jgi:uncharacterized protein YqgC (DUF456 family)
MEVLIWILLIAGIVGAVLPMIPGPILSAIGLLVAVISGQLEGATVWMLIIGGFIIFLIDFLMPAYLTKKSGASKRASNGALIGMILSLFTGPGLVLGAFIGAFIGEFTLTSDASKSAKASLYAVLGVFSGIVIKLIYTIGVIPYYLSMVYA